MATSNEVKLSNATKITLEPSTSPDLFKSTSSIALVAESPQSKDLSKLETIVDHSIHEEQYIEAENSLPLPPEPIMDPIIDIPVDQAMGKSVASRKSILEEHGLILGDIIGSGSYSKVRRAYSEELSCEVAVKIISKLKAPQEMTMKFLPREIDSVKGLRHDNLIKFYQSIETNHRVYLVMQVAENGSLLDYIREKKYLQEVEACNLFRQLISVLGYCHSKGVVHRDIKCENLLLDIDFNLKMIDFGFARKDTLTSDDPSILSNTFCGSYAYASPEILKGVPYNPVLSDIWSTGVVCYAMVFGRVPFDGTNLQGLLKKINSGLIFPKSPKVTADCKHMIFNILAPVKKRYRIAQIEEDPWFKGNVGSSNVRVTRSGAINKN